MIIKTQDVTSESVVKLVNFIESEDNKVPHDGHPTRVTTIKSMNPGSEKGLYSLDLEFMDCWHTGEYGGDHRTDAIYLTRVYEILIGS